MLLSGADILVKTLIEQGCDTVFGYPGGQILNVYDSLYMHQEQINHILYAHPSLRDSRQCQGATWSRMRPNSAPTTRRSRQLRRT